MVPANPTSPAARGDSMGNQGRTEAGDVQVMSAGTGALSKIGGGEGGILSSSPERLENGSKISVFRTTLAGCVYRQYVPEPVSHLKRIRADCKRFPPSCTSTIANRDGHQ
jgi:hypothetical protein